MSLLKQGIEKKHHSIKNKVLGFMFQQYLRVDPFDLSQPINAYYHVPEFQAYFSEMNFTQRSGEQIKRSVFHSHGFNFPDQQTVNDRLSKYTFPKIEINLNEYFVNITESKNFFRPPFFVRGRAMALNRGTKKTNKSKVQEETSVKPQIKVNSEKIRKRGKRRKLKERRKMQRERGIQRPDGLYLAADPHNIPYYGIEDIDLPDGTNMSSYLIHRKAKKSSITFFQYQVIYSYEQGVRQILGVHHKRRHLVDGKWKEEGFGPILAYLMDPLITRFDVRGFVGDGEYYNVDVCDYLILNELDFSIRADWTDELRKWCEVENLSDTLEDGEGVEVKKGRIISNGKQSHTLRLVVVKRGGELTPLVMPSYSKLEPEQALLLYEERFGIETNFRETGLRMGFTTAHSVKYRLALFGTACAMYNLVLSYYEKVVARSNNPSEWKVTLIEIMDILHNFQADYMLEAISKNKQTEGVFDK
ncbi:MAG: hypothetical protein ACC656_06625 [Candidatus Heimdallarchaeota archaeon]